MIIHVPHYEIQEILKQREETSKRALEKEIDRIVPDYYWTPVEERMTYDDLLEWIKFVYLSDPFFDQFDIDADERSWNKLNTSKGKPNAFIKFLQKLWPFKNS